MKIYKRVIIIIIIFCFFSIHPILQLTVNSSSDLKHFLGTVVNTGTNNGFSGSNNIGEKDPHFGWVLGRFFISGYTRVTGDMDEPIFIRTLDDEITLNFNLEQDIDALNNNENLTIIENDNAFDAYFGVPRTNFKRGTLIIRHTDWQNLTGDPIIYTDYLPALIKNADTLVEILEEGDYEVALNYAIRESGWFGTRLFSTTENYRIFFQFSVRNGESMVFPRDIVTQSELLNRAVTPNGFFLDLTKSRYLDIDIKKEVLVQSADGLTEDTRFNRPARDGVQYTEEGIYTITARNNYTNQETVKRIYVGTNNILIAHMNTGYSISEINEMILLGATITDDGDIILPTVDEESLIEDNIDSMHDVQNNNFVSEEPINNPKNKIAIVIGVVVLIMVIIAGIILFKKKFQISKQAGGNE